MNYTHIYIISVQCFFHLCILHLHALHPDTLCFNHTPIYIVKFHLPYVETCLRLHYPLVVAHFS
jgi:hypothetical protein